MQIRHGLMINGPLPEIADTYTGKAVIVLGSGLHAYAEFDQARAKYGSADIMAVNNSLLGLEFQIRTEKIKIEHWVSAHPEHFYFGNIWMKGLTINHSWTPDEVTKPIVWPFTSDGSSGLLAVKIALLLGYDKIVIAGIPLDDQPRFYDHPNTVYHMADPSVFQSWMDLNNALSNVPGDTERKKICAVSGKPAEIFGGLQ